MSIKREIKDVQGQLVLGNCPVFRFNILKSMDGRLSKRLGLIKCVKSLIGENQAFKKHPVFLAPIAMKK